MSQITTSNEKAREARIRRAAGRLGRTLERAKTRTNYHHEFGTYQLVSTASGRTVASSLQWGFGLTLDDVERSLSDQAAGGVDPVSK